MLCLGKFIFYITISSKSCSSIISSLLPVHSWKTSINGHLFPYLVNISNASSDPNSTTFSLANIFIILSQARLSKYFCINGINSFTASSLFRSRLKHTSLNTLYVAFVVLIIPSLSKDFIFIPSSSFRFLSFVFLFCMGSFSFLLSLERFSAWLNLSSLIDCLARLDSFNMYFLKTSSM